MQRRDLYIYALAAVIILILLIALYMNNNALRSANNDIEMYKKQQRELARLITVDYLPDMEAAKKAWKTANPDDSREFQNEGFTIEADLIVTPSYSAVLDPADPSYVSIGASSGDVNQGEVMIGLGKYYSENMTRYSGWYAMYTVDRSEHKVSGLTAVLVQNIAYQYYVKNIGPTVYKNLGVSESTVLGYTPQTIDTSITDDAWLDVTEYKYDLRNTGVVSYLLVKTYVNASTEEVRGVEISSPYYTSVTGVPNISATGIQG